MPEDVAITSSKSDVDQCSHGRDTGRQKSADGQTAFQLYIVEEDTDHPQMNDMIIHNFIASYFLDIQNLIIYSYIYLHHNSRKMTNHNFVHILLLLTLCSQSIKTSII